MFTTFVQFNIVQSFFGFSLTRVGLWLWWWGENELLEGKFVILAAYDQNWHVKIGWVNHHRTWKQALRQKIEKKILIFHRICTRMVTVLGFLNEVWGLRWRLRTVGNQTIVVFKHWPQTQGTYVMKTKWRSDRRFLSPFSIYPSFYWAVQNTSDWQYFSPAAMGFGVLCNFSSVAPLKEVTLLIWVLSLAVFPDES